MENPEEEQVWRLKSRSQYLIFSSWGTLEVFMRGIYERYLWINTYEVFILLWSSTCTYRCRLQGRGLGPDAQPCQEAHSPLLLQISTLFSNLTFLGNKTLRPGSSHTRLLCLALSGFKPRPAYLCIMLGRHVVFFQPQLKPCFNGCFFQKILPKKTKFIPFSNTWLPWSSLLELSVQSCLPSRTVNCTGMRIYLEWIPVIIYCSGIWLLALILQEWYY